MKVRTLALWMAGSALLGMGPASPQQTSEDQTRQILAKNNSPDVGFTFSVNPYRGCFHACAYCYARPSHEYLSLGAGTDFDRKIVVKLKAAELLRAAFAKKSWRKETVVFSGVTDCYQPLDATVSFRQLFFANAARSSSAARSFTMILRSKSVPAPRLRYSCDGRA